MMKDPSAFHLTCWIYKKTTEMGNELNWEWVNVNVHMEPTWIERAIGTQIGIPKGIFNRPSVFYGLLLPDMTDWLYFSLTRPLFPIHQSSSWIQDHRDEFTSIHPMCFCVTNPLTNTQIELEHKCHILSTSKDTHTIIFHQSWKINRMNAHLSKENTIVFTLGRQINLQHTVRTNSWWHK